LPRGGGSGGPPKKKRGRSLSDGEEKRRRRGGIAVSTNKGVKESRKGLRGLRPIRGRVLA